MDPERSASINREVIGAELCDPSNVLDLAKYVSRNFNGCQQDIILKSKTIRYSYIISTQTNDNIAITLVPKEVLRDKFFAKSSG